MSAKTPKTKSKSTTTTTVHSTHPTYRTMISEAIVSLHERSGSSRQAIKKYIHNHYPTLSERSDQLINNAIRKGVDEGDFVQPKGPSGPVRLAHADKHAVMTPAPTPASKKRTTATAKKAATKKTTKPKKSSSAASTAPKRAGKAKAKGSKAKAGGSRTRSTKA